MTVKAGSWGIRVADLKQEREFKPLFCCDGQGPCVHGIVQPQPVQALRVPLFLVLKAKQPAEAWKLGYWAGWPEMMT